MTHGGHTLSGLGLQVPPLAPSSALLGEWPARSVLWDQTGVCTTRPAASVGWLPCGPTRPGAFPSPGHAPSWALCGKGPGSRRGCFQTRGAPLATATMKVNGSPLAGLWVCLPSSRVDAGPSGAVGGLLTQLPFLGRDSLDLQGLFQGIRVTIGTVARQLLPGLAEGACSEVWVSLCLRPSGQPPSTSSAQVRTAVDGTYALGALQPASQSDTCRCRADPGPLRGVLPATLSSP